MMLTYMPDDPAAPNRVRPDLEGVRFRRRNPGKSTL